MEKSFIKKSLLFGILCLLFMACSHKEQSWEIKGVTSTFEKPWVDISVIENYDESLETIEISIKYDSLGDPLIGFGACFNELGWAAISQLSDKDKEIIFDELFKPEAGANFNFNRLPLGANDFSLDYYSFDETPNDFELKDFSLSHDDSTLVPFIKEALKRNPEMKLWASPWCPPKWMKRNNHYAMVPAWPGGVENGLKPEQIGYEGQDMFIMEDKYLETYAQYFGKFIDAYRERGINIFMVMPQNEFNSAQPYPACCWTAEGLGRFIAKLGPVMDKKNVETWLGTVERANISLIDTIMANPEASKYIKGVGFQWAGKDALPLVAEKYPGLKLMQTEQVCGDGANDIKMWETAWNLMNFYLKGGAVAYDYWNIALEKGGISRWGWSQNSLIVVDKETKSFSFTPEYYMMKHFSHFLPSGSKLIKSIEGDTENIIAFSLPDNSLILIVANFTDKDKNLKFKIENKEQNQFLQKMSVTTLQLKNL